MPARLPDFETFKNCFKSSTEWTSDFFFNVMRDLSHERTHVQTPLDIGPRMPSHQNLPFTEQISILNVKPIFAHMFKQYENLNIDGLAFLEVYPLGV